MYSVVVRKLSSVILVSVTEVEADILDRRFSGSYKDLF